MSSTTAVPRSEKYRIEFNKTERSILCGGFADLPQVCDDFKLGMALHVPKDPVYNNLLEACDEGPFIRDADQKRFQISAARLEGLLADKGIRSPIFVPSGGPNQHLHAKLVTSAGC